VISCAAVLLILFVLCLQFWQPGLQPGTSQE